MNSLMIQSLMDPAGAPSHPVLFLVLGVVTFALHMTAVCVMIGSLALAVFGSFREGENWKRLVPALAFTAKVSLTAAIVLGVAPLLFVQVIYDPFWYASSLISAWWTLAFLAVIIAAYLMLFRFDFLNHGKKGDAAGREWLAASLVLLIVCGFIIHAIANQALLPQRWMEWYAPGGVVDTSGRSLHYISHSRLLFFLSLSLPVTAAWICGMRRYILGSDPDDVGYADFLVTVAGRTGLIGAALSTAFLAVWLLTLPREMGWFATSFWVVFAVIPVAFFWALPAIQEKRKLCPTCNYLAFVMALVMVILVAVAREALRLGTLLDSVGWNPLDYKISMDWPTTIIFFVTFLVVGGLNLAFLLTTAWKGGHAKGAFRIEGGLAKLGAAAVASLVVWIAGYFIVGAAVML